MPSVLLQPVLVPPPAADTAAAGPSLGARLRADTAWVEQVTQPTQAVDTLRAYVADRVLDPNLWIGVVGAAVKVALVLLLAQTAVRLLTRAAQAYGRRFAALPPTNPRRQRVTTLVNLAGSAARYVIWPLALVSVLGQVGLDVKALLATAGIAGLAVGFGAQTLVRDVISGVFLLFDDTIHVGDTVRVGTDEGTVEAIGVRLIKVRKFNGELMMVPAGELRVFGNKSIGYARALVNVALPYGTAAGPVLAVMQRVAEAWAERHRDVLLEPAPDVQAITEFGDASATARVVLKVLPDAQFGAERDLRLALLEAFREAGIEIAAGPRTLVVQPAPPPTVDAAAPPALPDPPASAPPAPAAGGGQSPRDPRAPSDPPRAAPPTET